MADLFGGGLITDFIKHSKMDTAEPQLAQAKKDLEAFEKELKDIHVTADLRMEIGSFLSFVGFLFRRAGSQIIWCRARLQMQENRWMMPSTG